MPFIIVDLYLNYICIPALYLNIYFLNITLSIRNSNRNIFSTVGLITACCLKARMVRKQGYVFTILPIISNIYDHDAVKVKYVPRTTIRDK